MLIFEFPFRFGLNAHGVVPYLIDLRFVLAAPTQRIAVFFFTYNILVKTHSDFLSLSFLSGVGVMVDLGLLLVNPLGVETTASSRISLNCC